MSLSPVCPNCHLPEVVHEVWTSLCLNCLHKQDHGDPTVVPDVDPGVDRPVRPGFTLTSNAGAHVFEDNTEPAPEPVDAVASEVAAAHEPQPDIGADAPPAPPSEAPPDGA